MAALVRSAQMVLTSKTTLHCTIYSITLIIISTNYVITETTTHSSKFELSIANSFSRYTFFNFCLSILEP